MSVSRGNGEDDNSCRPEGAEGAIDKELTTPDNPAEGALAGTRWHSPGPHTEHRGVRRTRNADGTDEDSTTVGVADRGITTQVAVTIDGAEPVVGFTGTTDQTGAGTNCPFGNVVSVTEYIVKYMLLPGLPNAGGFFDPVEVTAPENPLSSRRANPRPASSRRQWRHPRLEDSNVRGHSPSWIRTRVASPRSSQDWPLP